MKKEDLEAIGLSKEQIDKVCDLNNADISPLKAELQKAKDDLAAANEKMGTHETTIKELKKDLEEFKDADVSGLKQKISDLENDIKTKDAEYQKQISDRDFNDMLKDCISAAHGKNQKAITALLDLDSLKASKNQNEDVKAAIKALTEAEDSKMLFGEPEANIIGTGSPIGKVGGTQMTAEQKEDADCRAAMGLPPVKTEGDK